MKTVMAVISGKIWCCPEDNALDYYPNEAFWVIYDISEPGGGSPSQTWTPYFEMRSDDKSDPKVIGGAAGNISLDLDIHCTYSVMGATCEAECNVRVTNGGISLIGNGLASCRNWMGGGSVSSFTCYITGGKCSISSNNSCYNYSNGSASNNFGTKFHFSVREKQWL